MKRWHWIVCAGALYALALLVLAPASVLDPLVRRASAQQLRLVDIEGSLWSGRAVVTLAGDATQRPLSWPLRWRWLPAGLLQGAFALHVETTARGTLAMVMLHYDRVQVRNLEIDAPAAALGRWLPALSALELGGTVHLSIATLVWQGDEMSAQAALRWPDASTPYAGIAPLGEYYFACDINRMLANVSLQTLSGPLRVEGQGAWRAGAAPEFKAVAYVAPAQRALFEPLLQKLATALASTNFSLRCQ